MVFNKIDALNDRTILQTATREYRNRVFISATRGINILGLKEEVQRLLEAEFVEKTVRIPQDQQKLISQLHSAGEVLERLYEDAEVILRLRLRKKDLDRVESLVQKKL
jgi:GTP-binding protein HflX